MKIPVSKIICPPLILTHSTPEHVKSAIRDLAFQSNASKYVLPVVRANGKYVAIDNLEILQASHHNHLETVVVRDLGELHPYMEHLKCALQKEMMNPAGVVLAIKELKSMNIVDEKLEPMIRMNLTVRTIRNLAISYEYWDKLYSILRSIIESGVAKPPPRFFQDFALLSDADKDSALRSTVFHFKTIGEKQFKWPQTKQFHEYRKTTPKKKERSIKKYPFFQDPISKQQYVVDNGKVFPVIPKYGMFERKDDCSKQYHVLSDSDLEYLKFAKDKYLLHTRLNGVHFDGKTEHGRFLLIYASARKSSPDSDDEHQKD